VAQVPVPPASGSVDTVESHHPAISGPIALAQNAPAGGFLRADWTAQLGVYSRLYKARVEAIRVHAISGMGIPRIARVERHGRTMWDAQLAGLTLSGAHQTCSALAARGAACIIIAPQSDHLAMLDDSAG
jgi:hypothetical protein